ncbi:hypothetical protein [Carnobacterium maltaromaticum]|jgi:hypothetical protein|uniref:hypothetical protein n=1 Tax=Carnobacterium maltaromaticum TaxID=2751 RepID=UPI000712DA9F|nr:hypothetical protein [Carnobacterium maltaromaticum]KRN66303.1 hypothetical protein IV70_GL001857 [Carnobacterium maltaromaticum DSM 20342]
MKKQEITGFSVVTEKNELIASIDFLTDSIIYIDGYKVLEHTKEEPAMFKEAGSSDSN